jgi:hypothetical protein
LLSDTGGGHGHASTLARAVKLERAIRRSGHERPSAR